MLGGMLSGLSNEEALEDIVAALHGKRPARLDAASSFRSKTAEQPAPDMAPTKSLLASALAGSRWPSEAGRLLDLPRISRGGLNLFLDALTRRLITESGYTDADPERTGAPQLPAGTVREQLLVKESADGQYLLRLGIWRNLVLPPQLGVFGGVRRGGAIEVNPDLEAVAQEFKRIIAAYEEFEMEAIASEDLEIRLLPLSYIDAKSAIDALRALGVNTAAFSSPTHAALKLKDLPLVVELPGPRSEAKGLVGSDLKSASSKFGGTMLPAIAGQLAPEMVASPTSQLLVMFHPSFPEQFSRVERLMDDTIDRPARQIFVEAMIIEIDSLGLEELGLEWEFESGNFSGKVGSLTPSLGGGGNTIDLGGDSKLNLPGNWKVNIRALISDGKAEILSRPSILTLNGRQATIRVGQEIPVATSLEGISAGSSTIAFDFNYIPVGILLNIRPQISKDNRDISMMIDIVISSRIPGTDLELLDSAGRVLASAPTIDSRRVQTYARIQNNTPFIVGGLVSRQVLESVDRVPVLGRIPVLGNLFRSTSKATIRREVIIVLTPYVLPDRYHLSRALPKGDLIDSVDSDLFLDTRRIMPQDTFPVGFLYLNDRFARYRELARAALQENFRLAEQEPFQSFADLRLPGEEALVHIIVQNTLQRLRLADRISQDRILLLTDNRVGSYQVIMLDSLLARLGEGADFRSFFEKHPGKALALTFSDLHEASEAEDFFNDPVPGIELLDCPDRRTWMDLMWRLNQPEPGERHHYTVLLHQEQDLMRLRRAILLRSVLELNGARVDLSLFNFIPGRIIQIPEIDPQHPLFLNSEIARYFYHSVHFYKASIQEIENALEQLDVALRRPEFRHLMKGWELPPFRELEPKDYRKDLP